MHQSCSAPRVSDETTIRRYYLHCTDGTDFVLDGKGVKAETQEEALGYASSLSQRLMHSMPDYEDWASWAVCVYDEHHRMVGTVPFQDSPPTPAAAEITDDVETSLTAAQGEAARTTEHHLSVRELCRYVRSVYATAAARWRREVRRQGGAA